MNTLLAIHDLAMPIIAQSSDGLVRTIRTFLAPPLLLAIGIASVTFLFQRELTKFIVFACIAVLVCAVFFAPEIIGNLGQSLGQNNQNWN